MAQPLSHRTPWLSHPRFESQALIVASHDDFLRAGEAFSARLATLQRGDGLSLRARKRQVDKLPEGFSAWRWSMGCHERFEEERLYPQLLRRLGVSCQHLADEHESLAASARLCEESLSAIAIDAHESFAVAGEQLRRYREALAQHLRVEEELIVPRLLELSETDFVGFMGTESCSTRSAS